MGMYNVTTLQVEIAKTKINNVQFMNMDDLMYHAGTDFPQLINVKLLHLVRHSHGQCKQVCKIRT